ncbi:MAG: glycoside hydrolase family protein [Bacteroidales bacterium]|jgi:hypothetical protein|nr:glycoside hydrolase family protein [Bacteroidales bacterium]MDD4770084.1 glycoside hydrolase family protein [Bacteroidales bacterium]HKL93473.1 glycoside hydrolase family protein [Bacteroidales bacterium]
MRYLRLTLFTFFLSLTGMQAGDTAAFCKQLKPLGRILETKDWYVWCVAPIYGPDEKVHVFYSRWPASKGMGGWISSCEIAHAVADQPEGPYTYVSTVLAPRPGFWDATTCHNPHIQEIDGTYYLFYMGNNNRKTNSKRIGLAKSNNLYGPWERSNQPLLETGAPGSWDDHCTTNPAFLAAPDGSYRLYYKSWNDSAYVNEKGSIRGNRKYGLALADKPEGPYTRYASNPIIDFSSLGANQQVEDAYVWYEEGRYRMLMRDMGFYNHTVGLYFESTDGLYWSKPEIAWLGMDHYRDEPPAPSHLKRYGRLERPQLLMKDGKPAYLFNATQGGAYQTASGFVFKIERP